MRLRSMRRSRQDAWVRCRERLVLEDTFVDRAELLDAEVGICDAVATCGPARRRQRQHGATHHGIGDANAIDERRVCGRKQAAIERRDGQIARAAPGVREP